MCLAYQLHLEYGRLINLFPRLLTMGSNRLDIGNQTPHLHSSH